MDIEKLTVDTMPDDAAPDNDGEEKVVDTGADAQPAKVDPKWLKPRLDREREAGYKKAKAEIEAQYAPLKAVEEHFKQMYPDKTIDDILFEERVKQAMQEDPDLKEATAKRLVRAEMGSGKNPEPAKVQRPVADQHMELLKQQAQDIAEEYGDNMAELLKANPDVMARVAEGELDLYKARREIRSKSGVPVIKSPTGTAPGTKGIKDMTQKEWERMNQAIRNGHVYK